MPFENLSKVARCADGSFAVVFDSNKRIARVGADGELIYLVPSRNDPEKGFYFANEIAFDPAGRLYVASTYIDTATLTVNREAIVRFSPEGRPEAVLYSLAHAPEPYVDNIGTIRSLSLDPAGDAAGPLSRREKPIERLRLIRRCAAAARPPSGRDCRGFSSLRWFRE